MQRSSRKTRYRYVCIRCLPDKFRLFLGRGLIALHRKCEKCRNFEACVNLETAEQMLTNQEADPAQRKRLSEQRAGIW